MLLLRLRSWSLTGCPAKRTCFVVIVLKTPHAVPSFLSKRFILALSAAAGVFSLLPCLSGSQRLRAACFHRLISCLQALRSSVGVVGRVADVEASTWHVPFVPRRDLLWHRMIYGTLVQHAAPVAIVPQPVLSHSGFSQAPEKVSAALFERVAPACCQLVLQTVIDLARLLACGLVRRPPPPPERCRNKPR